MSAHRRTAYLLSLIRIIAGNRIAFSDIVQALVRGILRRENPMYTYWHGPPLQRRVVLKWFYSLSRRNNFVGGTCAPPSALQVGQCL